MGKFTLLLRYLPPGQDDDEVKVRALLGLAAGFYELPAVYRRQQPDFRSFAEQLDRGLQE